MADKDDFKLDDLEFSNFDSLDFEFEDPFGDPPEDTGRDPVYKVARATSRAVGRNLKDPTQYIRTMRKALPSNYRRAWDIADEIKGQGNELYNRALGRAAPALKEIKRGINKVVPSLQGKLPKALVDKLEELTTTYEGSETSVETERDNQIAAIMAETFSEQVKRDNQRWEAEKVRTAVLEKSEKERHIESLMMLNGINSKLGGIKGYNENITYKYQKSMLEVNFRQLFALRDIILTQQESARNITKQLDAVIKNTGLPDAVKLKMSEQFGLLGRETMIKRFQDGLGGNLSSVISNLGKRLSDKAYNMIGGIGDAIEQMSMMAAMGGQMSPTTMAGEMIGGLATDKVSDMAAEKLSALRKGNNLLRNSNAALGRQIANAPYSLAEFARTDPNTVDPKDRKWYHATTDDYVIDKEGNYTENSLGGKALGGVMGFMRSLIDESLSKDSLEKRDNAASMMEPTSFTRRNSTALNDIIPGLLAMQLREVTMLRTGKEAPLMTWDYGRGRFEAGDVARTRIESNIKDRLDGKRNKRNVNEVIDELDNEKKLSEEDRQALALQLLHNNRNRRSFDVSVLGDAKNYQAIEDQATRERLAMFFSENYGDTAGWKGDPERNVRMRRATEGYSRLGSLIPSVLDEMELQMNLGNSELLLEMGLLKYEDNAYTYNHDAIIKFIMESDAADAEVPEEELGVKMGKVFYEALSKAKKKAFSGMSKMLTPVKEQFDKTMETERAKSIRDFIRSKSDPLTQGAKDQWEKGKATLEEHRRSGRTIKDLFSESFDKASVATKERYNSLRDELGRLLEDGEYRDSITKTTIKNVEDIVNDMEDRFGNLVINAKELRNLIQAKLVEAYEDPRVQNAVNVSKQKYDEILEKYRTDPRLEPVRQGVESSQQFAKDKANEAKDFYKNDERAAFVREIVEEIETKGAKEFGKEKAQVARDGIVGGIEKVRDADYKGFFSRMRESANEFYSQKVKPRFEAGTSAASETFEEKTAKKRTEHIYSVIEQILEVQQQALEEQRNIIATLQAGIFVNADSGEKMGRMRTVFAKGWDMTKGVRSLTGGILRGLGHAAKGAGYLTGKLGMGYGKMVGAGFGLATGVLGMAKRATHNMLGLKNDIFVEGKPYPVLHWKGIKEGIYQDLTTGKIIKKLSDIKGPVKNLKTNEPAITEEDFQKGLYDTAGKPVLRGIVRKIGSIYSAALSPIATTLRFGANAYKATMGKIFEMKDVYTKKDRETPKLYGSVMKAGGYFSKKTGKVIKHYRDLDGEIIDQDRQVVLTMQDYRDGLCDINGKPLKTIADRTLGIIGGTINLAKNAVVGSVKTGWKMMRGMFNLGKGIFSGIRKKFNINFGSIEEANYAANNETNMLLESIYALLDERLPGKKLFGDNDGDGVKEGSVQDILRRRKAAQDDKETKDKEKSESKGGGWMSKITGLLGGLLGGKKDGEDDGEGEGDTYVGGFSGGDGDVDTDKKGKKNAKKPKKLGKIGKWMQAAKNSRIGGALARMGGSVMGFGGRMVGRAAAGAAIGAIGGSMLGMGGVGATIGGALAVVGGILASPWVLGALAIGALGYGAYKLYKYMQEAELRDYRILQYGLVSLNDSQVSAIETLEERMSKFVVIDGKTANLKVAKEDIIAAAEEMGVEEKHSEEFVIWFMGRFKPIFLNYMAAVKSLKPDASIKDIDSRSFTAEMRLKLLDMVEVPSSVHGPYATRESPFGKETVLYSETNIFIKAEELRKKYSEEVKENKKDEKQEPKVLPDAGIKAGDLVAPSTAVATAAAPVDEEKRAAQRRLSSMSMMTGGGAMYGIGSMPMSQPTKTNTNAVYKGSSEAIVDTKTAPSQVEIIRLKAYGLVELEALKVNQLLKMEKELYGDVFFVDQKATLKMDGLAALDKFGAGFGVSATDEKQAASWLRWFNYRFIRVFLDFCTSVHQYNENMAPMDAAKSLQPEQLLTVANAILAAKTANWFGRSVWSISESPWNGYVMNTDASSAQGNLQAIEQGISLRKFNDAVRMNIKMSLPEALQTPAIKGTDKVIAPLLKPAANPSGTGRDNDNLLTRTQGRVQLDNTMTSQRHMSMGVYAMPCQGRISSDYGTRIHPITGKKSDHKGIDIAAPNGTPVVAAQDGTIARREYSQSYGNVIYINHPDGNSTRYAHLQNFAQGHSVGSEVARGEIIGYVGNTGKSAGNHLHFEVRKGHGANATPMDPMKFLSDRYSKDALKELQETKKALKEEEKVNDDMTEGEDTIASTEKKTTESQAAFPKDRGAIKFDVDLPNMGGNKSGFSNMRDTAPVVTPDAMAPTSESAFNPNPSQYRQQQADRQEAAVEANRASVAESSKHQRDMMKIAQDSLGELRGINSGVKEMAGLLKDLVKQSGGKVSTPAAPNRTGKADVVSLRK